MYLFDLLLLKVSYSAQRIAFQKIEFVEQLFVVRFYVLDTSYFYHFKIFIVSIIVSILLGFMKFYEF